jgi:GNAT superfamily N-acetyltransferase
MITIKEATTKSEMREFVKFPFSLYKDNPYWIPPIIQDELDSFNPKINPVFESAIAKFYMAYKDGNAVGRTVAIINWDEVNQLKKLKVRFGWFDVIDDVEVTRALLDKVIELGHEHGMKEIEGPLGFSNLDKVGALTMGFDQIGTMISWYNHPYYITHFEQLGLKPEKEFIESIFSFSNVDPTPFVKAEELIKKRYGLVSRNYTTTREVMNRADEMFDLFNRCYAHLSSFVPVSDKIKAFYKKKYISFINPEYIKFIDDKDGNMIAFAIVMPSLSKAIQEAKGKLFPFGFLKILKAKKHSKEVMFYLIGVLPEYQNKGVTALIMSEYYKVFKKNKIETCIRTPELDENNPIHNLWKNFNPIIHKRRKTFLKPI